VTTGAWRRRRGFRQSIPYKILLVDGQLLSDDFMDLSSQLLLEIRTRILKQVDSAQDDEAVMRAVRVFVAKEAAAPWA